MVEVDESASAGSSAPLFLGPGVSFMDLLENDSRNILARLGGTLDDVDHRQLVIDNRLPGRKHRTSPSSTPQPAWLGPRPLSTAASSPACFFAKTASPSFNVFQ